MKAKGLRRLSVVGWSVVAVLLLLRAPIWAILHDLPAGPLYAAAILLPLAGHLACAWIVNGFES